MAQFDVNLNPNPRSRESVPFIVDVQSGFIDVLRTRLTIPLSRVGVGIPGLPKRLLPQFVVDGEKLTLHAHAAAGVDARLLRDPVSSLAGYSGEIRDALDAVASGI